ncbi:MAG: hypothetical protein EOP86_09065 [Verrucomicrobiaceae bacterium]|nr:MAG: hypothetical protein EOP86_09065 [Verrucomicrobiaceae bacterium]
MSFRRNKYRARHWQKWLERNRAELLACGIPQLVLEERPWYYFLEHGYWTPAGSAESILDVEQMDRAGAERLCAFLEQDDLYPGCSTLNLLQCLLGRGRHPMASRQDQRGEPF